MGACLRTIHFGLVRVFALWGSPVTRETAAAGDPLPDYRLNPRDEIRVSGQTLRLRGGTDLAVRNRHGNAVSIVAGGDSTVLLLSAAPIDEPVVGHGPFVMNSQAEIRKAMEDYRSGADGQPGARAVRPYSMNR